MLQLHCNANHCNAHVFIRRIFVAYIMCSASSRVQCWNVFIVTCFVVDGNGHFGEIVRIDINRTISCRSHLNGGHVFRYVVESFSGATKLWPRKEYFQVIPCPFSKPCIISVAIFICKFHFMFYICAHHSSRSYKVSENLISTIPLISYQRTSEMNQNETFVHVTSNLSLSNDTTCCSLSTLVGIHLVKPIKVK